VVVLPPPDPDSGTLAPDERYPDAGKPAESELCVVTADYVAEHKACASDTDCTLFEYQSTCCAESNVVGLTLADLTAARACADSIHPVCDCKKGLSRAEDGRVVTERSPAMVQCVDKQCVSRIAQRRCGASRSCTPGQICVTYENVPGGIPADTDSKDNAYLTFRCEPNPCHGELACDCAQPLCDARNDAVRMCEIMNNAEADLTCRPDHD
jgi:hypothetical protein